MITFVELKNKSHAHKPILILEKFFGQKKRKLLKNIFIILIAVVIALLAYEANLKTVEIGGLSGFVRTNIFVLRSLLVLLGCGLVSVLLLQAFFYSKFFDNRRETDFHLASILFSTDPDDLTKSFMLSKFGVKILERLNIGPESISNFIDKRSDRFTDVEFEMPETKTMATTSNYLKVLFHSDQEFQNFLYQNKVNDQDLVLASEWVTSEIEKEISRNVWWSKEFLVRIPSVGRNWAFGKVNLLEKFGHSIFDEAVYKNIGNHINLYKSFILEMEKTLLKGEGTNVMVISETSDVAMEAICALAKTQFLGSIHTDLEGKRIFVVDGAELIDATKDKIAFENIFRNLFKQASVAGNVILVIPRMPYFIESASSIGVNLSELLSDFLTSINANVIALAESGGFHQSIETNKDLMSHFEKVKIGQTDDRSLLITLIAEASEIERHYNVFYTFPALKKLTDSIIRFWDVSEYTHKAFDLIEDLRIESLSSGKKKITDEDVLNLVSRKTTIPLGTINQDEHNKLSNLEEVLHARVIGQDLAIESISKSIKRARVDIQNSNRPIGSFLFLGPTGVGKTETTKALAEAFFGDEKNINRLDMSEYNMPDSIEKLIGQSGGGQVGTLSTKIRNRPYGVLLLDEFEKSHSKVHDLFLQIIDEGVFTDNRGEIINCRNLIIIATSNAGSDLIYNLENSSGQLLLQKDSIIDAIIKNNIFKPELLNRFDGIILFHALNQEHLREIAKLMIAKLQKRLSTKGLRLEVSQEMLEYIIKAGTSQKFGARAMNRAIQDILEAQVAEAIIDGSVRQGSLIKFKLNPQSQELEISV